VQIPIALFDPGWCRTILNSRCRLRNESQVSEQLPIRIRADFNGLFRELLRLSHNETCIGADGQDVVVHEGMPVTAFDEDVDEDGKALRGHLKSGQWWSLQNRPTECGLGLGCFTPTPPEEASLFLCANSVDRI
jgi:hypothetical protein